MGSRPARSPTAFSDSSDGAGAPLLFCCLCCLCNKLARHWFIPKTRHTDCVGLRRDTSGSCRAHSPALLVGRRDRVASWSWSCASHPHAHLHAQVGLISASAAPSASAVTHHCNRLSIGARARMHSRSSSRIAAAATHRRSVCCLCCLCNKLARH